MRRVGPQFGLNLEIVQTYRRTDFIVSSSNADAIAALDAWAEWPNGTLALVGPEGAGKTHLAWDWAYRHNALFVSDAAAELIDLSDLEGRLVVVDDAQDVNDETLFHLINLAAAPGGRLLLTARDRPSLWTPTLPDLRSRLNALQVAELKQPDDVVLRGVLDRLFRQRAITPPSDVLDYMVMRIERSVAKAREVVARMDIAAHAQGRPISTVLARKVLASAPDLLADGGAEDGDLFG
jgi:chromosomal replication initiation ATPase DnaA